MKKRLFVVLMSIAAIAMCACLTLLLPNSNNTGTTMAKGSGTIYAGQTATTDSGGDGSEEYPYLIGTASVANLNSAGSWVRKEAGYANTHFKLIADLNLNAFTYWSPIPTLASGSVFDGNGYQIQSMRLVGTTSRAFFTTINNGATVKNLTFTNVISGNSTVAVVAGSTSGNVTLENVVLQSGNISVGSVTTVGGFVGDVLYGKLTINNSKNFVNITSSKSTAYKQVGGFVGSVGSNGAQLEINKSENNGNIISADGNGGTTNARAGGFVGQAGMNSTVTISDSINRGDVTRTGSGTAGSSASFGGFVGFSNGTVNINDSVSIGGVSNSHTGGSDSTHGLAGGSDVNVDNSYYDQSIVDSGANGGEGAMAPGAALDEKVTEVENVIAGIVPFDITLPAEDGYTFVNTDTEDPSIFSNGTYKFTVQMSASHNLTPPAAAVYSTNTNALITTATLTRTRISQNPMTYEFTLSNVGEDVTIAITAEKNKYRISFPAEWTGYEIDYSETISPQEIEHGTAFEFTLELDTYYQKSTPVVSISDPAQPSGQSTLAQKSYDAATHTYTYETTITRDTTIYVNGIEIDTYAVTMPAPLPTGVTAVTKTSVQPFNAVEVNSRFDFTVTLGTYYTQTRPNVKVVRASDNSEYSGSNLTTQGINGQSVQSYYFEMPSFDVKIIVEPVINKYNVTFPSTKPTEVSDITVGGESVYPDGTTVQAEYGKTDFTFTVTMAANYNVTEPAVFSGSTKLTATAAGAGAWTFAIPSIGTSNVITINPVINKHTITHTPGANYTISPNTVVSLNHNATQIYTINVTAAYTNTAPVVKVTKTAGGATLGNGTLTPHPTIKGQYTYTTPAITENANITIDNIATENEYNVTLVNDGEFANGTISVDKDKVTHGGSVTISFVPENHDGSTPEAPIYKIAQLIINGTIITDLDAPLEHEYSPVTSDLNISAVFVKNTGLSPITVKLISDETNFTFEPTDKNETVSLTPGTGWQFTVELPASHRAASPRVTLYREGTTTVIANVKGAQTNGILRAVKGTGSPVVWTYTISSAPENQNIDIAVTEITADKYVVVRPLPTLAGHTFQNFSDATTPLEYRDTLTFEIKTNTANSHTLNALAVTGGTLTNATPTPVAGVYSYEVTNVTDNIVISVTDTVKSYAVTHKTDGTQSGKYVFDAGTSTSPVNHGSYYSFTITLDANYRGAVPAVRVNQGETALVPPAATGSAVQANGVYRYSFPVTATSEIEVVTTAPTKYDIRYTANGTNINSTLGNTAAYGFSFQTAPSTKVDYGTEDYTFTIVMTDGWIGTGNTPSITVTGAGTVTPVRDGNKFTCTFDITGPVNVFITTQKNTYTVTVPVPSARVGYDFVPANLATTTVTHGSKFEFTVSPDTGRTIAGVTATNEQTITRVGTTNTYNIASVTGDTAINVAMDWKTYNITIPGTLTSQITVDGGMTGIQHGTTVDYTVNAPANFFIQEITLNGTRVNMTVNGATSVTNTWNYGNKDKGLTSQELSFVITGNTTISAVFAAIPSTTVTFNLNYGDAGVYEIESGVVGSPFPTVIDPERFGYDFLGWAATASGSVVTLPTAYPAASTAYYAKWAYTEYDINEEISSEFGVYHVEQISNILTVNGTPGVGATVEWQILKEGQTYNENSSTPDANNSPKWTTIGYESPFQLVGVLNAFLDGHVHDGNKIYLRSIVTNNVTFVNLTATVKYTTDGGTTLTDATTVHGKVTGSNGSNFILDKQTRVAIISENPSTFTINASANPYFKIIGFKAKGANVSITELDDGTYDIEGIDADTTFDIVFAPLTYDLKLETSTSGVSADTIKVNNVGELDTHQDVVYVGAVLNIEALATSGNYRFADYQIRIKDTADVAYPGTGSARHTIVVSPAFLNDYLNPTGEITLVAVYDELYSITVNVTGRTDNDGNTYTLQYKNERGIWANVALDNNGKSTSPFEPNTELRLTVTPNNITSAEVTFPESTDTRIETVRLDSNYLIYLGGNLTVKIEYGSISYKITVENRYNGQVISGTYPDIENLDIGDPIEITANDLSAAEPYYQFTKWQFIDRFGQIHEYTNTPVLDTALSQEIAAYASGDTITLIAVYGLTNALYLSVVDGPEAKPYTLYLNGATDAYTDETDAFKPTDVIVIRPAQDKNFDFVGYYLNGEFIENPTGADISITMELPQTVTLVYAPKTYTLTINNETADAAKGTLVYIENDFQHNSVIVITFETKLGYEMKDMRIGETPVNEIGIDSVRLSGTTLSITVDDNWLAYAEDKGWLADGALTLDVSVETKMHTGVIAGIGSTIAFAVIAIIGSIIFVIQIQRKKKDYAIALEKHRQSEKQRQSASAISDIVRQAKEGGNA